MPIRKCEICNDTYDTEVRKHQPGKLTHCEDCADEDVVRLTGNMIYDHKTGAQCQINRDPEVTAYINKSTELRQKGSNMNNNSRVTRPKQKSGSVAVTVDGSNAKGKKE